jgi:hypothetical protein
MRFIFAIFACFALASTRAGDRPSAPDFSSYPPVGAFLYFLERQTNVAQHVGHILAVTKFTRFTKYEPAIPNWEPYWSVALVYWLSDSGAQSWDEHGFPLSGGSYRPYPRLSETQLKTVVSAIRELPPTNALPPIENLVLVSFRQGTNWVTRSYDKRSPPKAMELIGEVQQASWGQSFTVQ